ncbi:granule antigen gra6 domain-containing [Trichoderma arundinaceum]|uniref:Granule antigen gra6 domain-containing n=1 Tax=Trichoderma arundinaceum TaxID=490622 RepID=A0A395P0A9_TRIAR|nr:granule antigen gra6 domain-containing [Trichoderma arundinaceum]
MRRSIRLAIAPAICFAAFADADLSYVTDLEIFSLLAPCVSDAISYNIQTLTYSTICGDSETQLQSCACSDTERFTSISSSISRDIRVSCGSTATEDQQSASSVLVKYCNQDSTITFSTPTKNIVQAYITDLSQIEYLPQCAQSGLSQAVMGDNASKCPEAASLFAPCVCNKGGIPSEVSDMISKSVRYSCSNGGDITAAQDFYNEYCAMNNGTTTFTQPPGPPGDMTYHITALSKFKALRSCAQSGVASAILDQTERYCATGPQALASCVCIKSGMSGRISSTLTSYVKWNCDNTATADVTSALDVFDYYCSAAENEFVVSVTDTATETYPHPTNRASSNPSGPTQTGSKTSGGGGGGGGSDDDGSDSDPSGKDGSSSDGKGGSGSSSINKTAVIAACVLGGVVLIAAVAAVAFFVRRKRNKQMRGELLPPTEDGSNLQGPPELANTSKPGPNVAVVPELHSTERQELQGTGTPFSELPPGYITPRPELQGNGEYKPPVSPDNGTGYPPPQSPYYRQQQGAPTVSPATPSAHGVGWQSGPVAETYELDSATWRSS